HKLTSTDAGYELTGRLLQANFDRDGKLLSFQTKSNELVKLEWRKNQLSKIVYPDDAFLALKWKNNRLYSIKHKDGSRFNYRYDKRGRLIEVRAQAPKQQQLSSYAYDNFNRLTVLQNPTEPGKPNATDTATLHYAGESNRIIAIDHPNG